MYDFVDIYYRWMYSKTKEELMISWINSDISVNFA